MKILVTGANGYLGTGIVNELINSGNKVIATDYRFEQKKTNCQQVECDIFDVVNPYESFGKPDVLLHLAWKDGFIHYSDSHINDLSKHYNFIKSLAENGIKKIAVLGSMHEIGFYEGCINEKTPCNPITPYGISKNALRMLTEQLCLTNNVIFQWLRGFYIVGNSKRGCSIFSKIVAASDNNDFYFPFTSGQNKYDFIDYDLFVKYVSDTVSQEKINGIINICSGYPEKLADRVERFILDNRLSIKLKYGVFPDRPYDSKEIWGDNKKINEIENKQETTKIHIL